MIKFIKIYLTNLLYFIIIFNIVNIYSGTFENYKFLNEWIMLIVLLDLVVTIIDLLLKKKLTFKHK